MSNATDMERLVASAMVAAVSRGDSVYTDESACPTCGQAGTKTYRSYIDAASPPEPHQKDGAQEPE